MPEPLNEDRGAIGLSPGRKRPAPDFGAESAVSAKLNAAKNKRKAIFKEYQTILNRIRHIEEEEDRSRVKLTRVLEMKKNLDEGKKLKMSAEQDKKKLEAMRESIKQTKTQHFLQERERKQQLRLQLQKLENARKEEYRKLKKMKEELKSKYQQSMHNAKLLNTKKNQAERSARYQKRKELENLMKTQNLAINSARKQNKKRNEEEYDNMKKSLMNHKKSIVSNIRVNKKSWDYYSSKIASENHKKVLDSVNKQLQQEQAESERLQKMIAELREREVRAKRKLEDTKQQLEKIAGELQTYSSSVFEQLSPRKLGSDSIRNKSVTQSATF